MKYSNQINLFLAITGCIVVLWAFSQTYFQPSPFNNLDLADLSGSSAMAPSSQAPAVYQGEGTTNSKSAIYGQNSSRSVSQPNSSAGSTAAGGGSLRTGTAGSSSYSARVSQRPASSRTVQSGIRGQAVAPGSSGSPSTTDDNAGQVSDSASSTSRPTNVGGFSTPPAGQAMGMEQAKRVPEDSSSARKYVPYRSSMANRPN